MIEQLINGYLVVIRTADEMGGFPITGKRDAALIEVYDCGNVVGESEELVDSAWLTINVAGGRASLERVK